jgi:hypothetical protein
MATTRFRSGRGVPRNMRTDHVPVMVQSWLEGGVVVLRQLHRLAAVPPQGPQTTPRENGLAGMLVVLAAMVIESAVNRTRYVRGERVRKRPRRKDIGNAEVEPFAKGVEAMTGLSADGIVPPIEEERPEKYLSRLEEEKKVSPQKRLWERAREVFAIRDALAHNHLWESEAYWPAAGGLALLVWKRLAGYGDKRFESVVDEAAGVTRLLRLNVYPTRVWRRDAYVAFAVAMDVVAWLESLKHVYIPVTHVRFHWATRHGEEPRLMGFAELRTWIEARARELMVPDALGGRGAKSRRKES